MGGQEVSEIVRLLQRCQRGDRQALGELLEAHRSYLMLLARVRIGADLQGKADPSDVVQETFVRAQQKFPEFQGATEGELVCWLRAILASRLEKLARRYYGTQQRDVRLELQLQRALDHSSQALECGLATEQNSPSESFAGREQQLILADALESLPAHYREVIVLHHMEGLTFDQVAQRMGRSLGSVEKLWIRALAKLRGHLKFH